MFVRIESMSNADLLGVLVGPRKAAQLLQETSGSLCQLLQEPSAREYSPPLIASKLRAVTELVRRSLAECVRERDVLSSPQAVRDLLRIQLGQRDHEVFMALFLDAQHRAIALEEMFRGTLTQTSVYPREIVKRALQLNAAALIFAHNHPSGVAEPSAADEALTRTLRGALALIDVRVLDHFIVAGNSVLSFAEGGLL